MSCIKIVIIVIFFLPLITLLCSNYNFFVIHLMSGREDVAWLAHGGQLREMWCCPLPKGLATSQGPHGVVYTGKPHRDWLGNNEQTK